MKVQCDDIRCIWCNYRGSDYFCSRDIIQLETDNGSGSKLCRQFEPTPDTIRDAQAAADKLFQAEAESEITGAL